MRVAGLHSLPMTQAERIRRRVEASELGLLRVLFGRWDPDVLAIQQEGVMKRALVKHGVATGNAHRVRASEKSSYRLRRLVKKL